VTPKAIFLMGPTASGKTDLAIRLSQILPCDIISVDSAMIYRGMDIGTAKPSAQELAEAPHALLDIRDPAESYSVAQFRSDALALMASSVARGRIPLLVGGTMLYFKALLEGLSPLPGADPGMRAQIDAEAALLGWEALHRQLAQFDAEAAARIHPNDPQRLCRAIEVYRLTGQTLTELTQQQGDTLPYRVIQCALAPSQRELLHERIEQRFGQMLQQGFEEEVRALYRRGDLHPGLPSIRCVGYRQMWDYLTGAQGHDEMVFKGVAATRQLAKRQLTWLRGWESVNWLFSGEPDNLKKILSLVSDNSNHMFIM